MGSSFAWVGAKGSEDLSSVFSVLRAGGGTTGHGWTAAEAEIMDLSTMLEALEPLHEKGIPAVVAFCEQSDYACFAFAGGEQGAAGLIVLNVDAAVDYSNGLLAVEICRQRLGREWHVTAARGVALWSSVSPNRIGEAEVLRLMRKNWTYAEDALDRLWSRLGLPKVEQDDVLNAFEGAVWLQDSGAMSTLGGLSIDLGNERYVLGQGRGFWGIWDRQHPGPPVQRFDGGGARIRSVATRAYLQLVSQP